MPKQPGFPGLRHAMKMQVNIQDGDVMVSVDEGMVYVTPVDWKALR